MLELQLERSLHNQVSSTSQAKKLASVSATSLSMTGASMEVEQLERVPSIQYPVQFKSYTTVWALLDSSSKVNEMTPAYTVVLGLHIYFTNVKA